MSEIDLDALDIIIEEGASPDQIGRAARMMKSAREGENLPLEEPQSLEDTNLEPIPDPNEIISIRDIIASDILDDEKQAALKNAYAAANDREVLAPQREIAKVRQEKIAEASETSLDFQTELAEAKTHAEKRAVLNKRWALLGEAYGGSR